MKGDEGQGGSRPNPYRAVKALASPEEPPKPPALAPRTPAVNRSSFHDLCLLPLDLPTTHFSPQHQTSSSYPQAREASRREHPGTPAPACSPPAPSPDWRSECPGHIPSVLLGSQLCTQRPTPSVPPPGSPTLCAGGGEEQGWDSGSRQPRRLKDWGQRSQGKPHHRRWEQAR